MRGAPNPGLKRIEISAQTPAFSSGSLRVWVVPGSSGDWAAPPFRDLKDWKL
jgi:hypothetical protein